MAIRMRNNNLIIKKMPKEEVTKGGLIIPDSSSPDTAKAEILACNEDNDTGLHPGDVILIPFASGFPIDFEGNKSFVIKETDIICSL